MHHVVIISQEVVSLYGWHVGRIEQNTLSRSDQKLDHGTSRGKLHLLRLFSFGKEVEKKHPQLNVTQFWIHLIFLQLQLPEHFFPKKSNESQRLLEQPPGKKYGSLFSSHVFPAFSIGCKHGDVYDLEKILYIMGYLAYQLVQDFFHQQYHQWNLS